MAHRDIFELERTEEGAEFLRIGVWDRQYPVRTFFSTKRGGVSEGPFSSLNMGFSTDDERKRVSENRRRVMDFIGKEGYWEAVPHQVHKSEIVCIRKKDLAEQSVSSAEGQNSFGKLSFPDTDATITDAENVILTSLHADCIPVWLYEPNRHAAGLAHAGWRGTRADIAAKTAAKMCSELGCRMEEIRAVVGPGISRCCFEVGGEVVREFCEMLGEDLVMESSQRFCVDNRNGKYHLDLKAINAELLRRAGVEHIRVTDYCTCCEEDLFFSYRRDGGVTGRMCAGIMLTAKK